MHTVDSEQYGNVIVEVVHDEEPFDPRKDNDGILTTILGWHRRYDIGEGSIRTVVEDATSMESFLRELREELEDEHGPILLFAPLHWYEHSGVSCSLGSFPGDDGESLASFRSRHMDSAGWDSGAAGIVYVTAKRCAELGVDTDPKNVREQANAEVEQYAAYLRGDAYGYVVSQIVECDHGNEHRDVLDSCWGFIGEYQYPFDEGRSYVGWHIQQVLLGAAGRFR